MAAMEPDDLHARRDLDTSPARVIAPAPLSLLDLVIVRVQETDAVDVAL